MAEYVDLEINGNINIYELERVMSHQLPDWLKVLELKEIPLNFPSISDTIVKIEYVLSLEGLGANLISNYEDLRDKVNSYLTLKEKYIKVKRKSGYESIDLKSWVDKIQFIGNTSLEIALKLRGGKTIRIYDVLKGILGLKDDEEKRISVLKTKVHFKTD